MAVWTRQNISGLSPTARGRHSAVMLGDGSMMMVYGGSDLQYDEDESLWRLDYLGCPRRCQNEWKKIAIGVGAGGVTPGPRGSHVAVALADGTMALFGGQDKNDLWHFSMIEGGAGRWCQVNTGGNINVPEARTGSVAVGLADGSMIVIGGTNVAGVTLCDVWRARFRSKCFGSWQKLTMTGSSAIPCGPIGIMHAVLRLSDESLMCALTSTAAGRPPVEVWRIVLTSEATGEWHEVKVSGPAPTALISQFDMYPKAIPMAPTLLSDTFVALELHAGNDPVRLLRLSSSNESFDNVTGEWQLLHTSGVHRSMPQLGPSIVMLSDGTYAVFGGCGREVVYSPTQCSGDLLHLTLESLTSCNSSELAERWSTTTTLASPGEERLGTTSTSSLDPETKLLVAIVSLVTIALGVFVAMATRSQLQRRNRPRRREVSAPLELREQPLLGEEPTNTKQGGNVQTLQYESFCP
mmetsp:Transcript_28798/g.66990  ORF Transcript_28798/g.66990 Transcript_28798/m.66990 type:complete len:466 (-) Transcript_28798:82-1479(-)